MMSVLAIGVGWAETVTIPFDFETMGSNGWTSSYEDHIITNGDFSVLLASSNKQTSTITDVPVTKSGMISVTQPNTNHTITGVKLVLKQWGTKAKTVRLKTSPNGDVITNSSNFILEYNSNLSTNAVYFDWSEANNQVGIVSLEINYTTSSVATYSITGIGNYTGGNVTASVTSGIEAGTPVTLTISPENDYVLSNLFVAGEDVTGSVSNNQYTFNMPAKNVEVSVVFRFTGAEITYSLVTELDDIVADGEYLIVNSDKDAIAGTATSSQKYFSSISSGFEVDDNKITTNGTSHEIFTFESGANGGFLLKGKGNYYYKLTAGNSDVIYIGDKSDATDVFVYLSGGYAYIGATDNQTPSTSNRKLGYNTTASPKRFASYNPSITGQQKPVYLYKKDVGGGPTVAKPVITLDPAEGPYYEGSSVTATITCATEGASISYSTDGTNWSNYTQALTITETTTIQAKATLNNVESSVATKTVTFVEAPTTVADIAGFIALDADKEFTFTGDVVVTYVNSTNSNYVWVKDDSGSALFYELGLTPAPAQGAIIKGGWSGKKTIYEGLREITNVTGATIEGSATVTPAELQLSDVTENKQATYGWLRGVTITSKNNRNFTISDGTSTVNGYNTYNNDQSITVPDANDGKTYDILGIVNVHGNAQFTPIQFVAEAEAEYYLVGSFNTYVDENNETQWVQQDVDYKFTLTDDGKYVLDGVVCPDNVEFKILKVKGSQTTWCGGPADGEVYGIHGGWYKDIPLTIDGGKNYKIDAAGTFNFTMTIDKNNSNNNKFTVIKTPVVVKGSFDGWSENGEEMSINEDNNDWTITKQLGVNTEFGFRDGWGNWHGGNGKEIAKTDLGEILTMGSDGNFKILVAGEYSLSVNRDLTTLIVNQILTPHNIVVESGIEGGTIAIKDNKTTAVAGETVTIIVTPDEGYELGNLTVTNSNTQQPIEVSEDYTFVMPDADVQVSGEFVEILEAMFNFDRDYATLFPTIAGTSSGSGDTYVSDGDITEDVTATVDGVSLTVSPSNSNTPNRIWASSPRLRMYGGTITITAPNGYMLTGMEITQGKWNDGNTANVGILTNASWSGEATSVVVTIAGNTQFKSINVTYCEIPDDQVMDPVIEGETPFLETTTVTITCATEGAEIRYTLNGQDPTAESTLYEEPFTINEAVTVKAIAFKNGNSSSIASKAFEQIPIVATIADYLALDDNTTFVFTGDAVVTYQNGSNTWIKDETGYALIYASGQPEYSNGDVIPAGWGGKKMTYNNVPEITNPTGLESATETSEAIPVVKTVADITNDDVNAYYKINDIILSANTDNFNIVDGETELAGYNKFSITMPEDVEGKSFNVVGVITIYNNKPEFYIISCEEILQPVVLEGVAFTAERKWATWCGDEALALPENVTAYVVTGINTAGTAVEVESVNYIPANVGVLLYSNTAMESVSAMPAEAGESVTSLLQGGPATVNNAYVLYDNQFILAQDGTTVGAHRCYLPMTSEAQGAPRLLIGDPGTVTGIEDLRYDSNGKPVGYYDLTGRYVGTSLNGKRGIFISSDGKKVVR